MGKEEGLIGAFPVNGGDGGIDSNRLRAILTPSGRLRRPSSPRELVERGSLPHPLCW